MIGVLLLLCLVVIRAGWYDQANNQYSEKNNYQKIRETIMTNYNPDGWPSDSQVQVQTSLAVTALQLVSEITSSVVIKCVLRLTWYDPRLQWNPADYGNIKTIPIDMSFEDYSIWTPDITCPSLNGKIAFPDLDKSLLQVSYDGKCYWSRPGSLNIAQKFNLRNFPYDVQRISLFFESWLSPNDKQKLTGWDPNSSRKTFYQDRGYIDHLQWDCQNFEYALTEEVYTSGTYSQIKFELDIVRRGAMIETIVLVPGILISFMCVFAFALPREAPIRLIFQNSVMMTMIMFTKMVTHFLPVSDDKPFIEQIFTTLFIYVNVVVCFIVWSQNFYIKSAAQANKPKPPQHAYHTYQKKISTILHLIDTPLEQDKESHVQHQKQDIQQEIDQQLDKLISKPYFLRAGLLRPQSVDTIGYLFITVGGILGMYRGISSIQF